MVDIVNPPVRTKRRYGASCELCRKRKRKCPGRDINGISLCTHCSEVGVRCVFPSSGSARHRANAAASAKISGDFEVNDLKSFLRSLAIATDDEREQRLIQWTVADEAGGSFPYKGTVYSESSPGSQSSGHNSGSTNRPSKKSRNSSAEIDETDGELEEFGDFDGNESDATDPLSRPVSQLRLSCKSASIESADATPRPFIARNGTTELVDRYMVHCFNAFNLTGPSHEEAIALFNTYFCWQNPRNNICDRAVLERAIQENDSTFCTPFLVCSLYSHCIRHIPVLASRTDLYASKSHLLVASELCKQSSFPSIQGLLLLASHLAALGRYSEAWSLTGAAVAMVLDLDCHLEPKTIDESKLTPRSLLIRQTRIRLYWAAFSWDKSISLALNRKSFMSLAQHRPPFPGFTSSQEVWAPIVTTPNSVLTSVHSGYPPQISHQQECFHETSHVWAFVDEFLPELYGKRARRALQLRDFVGKMKDKMKTWESQLSNNVYMNLQQPVVVIPPPHIVQFNILVRLAWLLLYRPFYYSDKDTTTIIPLAITICEQSTVEICVLLQAYDSVFPLTRISYIHIYAAFCATTIDLTSIIKTRVASQEVFDRLFLAQKVLDVGLSTVPAMQKCVERLRKTLNRLIEMYQPSGEIQNQYVAPSPSSRFVPPVPYVQNSYYPVRENQIQMPEAPVQEPFIIDYSSAQDPQAAMNGNFRDGYIVYPEDATVRMPTMEHVGTSDIWFLPDEIHGGHWRGVP